MTKDNLILRALEYSREHPEGFTKSDLEIFLGVKESEWSTLSNQFGQGENRLFNQSGGNEKGELYNLSREGIRMLVQLDAVDNSRSSAKSANFAKWVAVFSALVALAALILGPYFSSKLVTTIELTEKQFNVIQNKEID